MERQLKNPMPMPPSARGFTLVELIAVMAIMALLAVATVPALQSLLQGTNLTQGGQTLSEQINLARQMASANNATVEVRLIQLPPTTADYNAIQLYVWPDPEQKALEAQQGTTPPPLSRMEILPPGVVISQNTTYSQLLTGLAQGSMSVPAGTAHYVSFLIGSSGMVEMTNTASAAAMPALYLGVVRANVKGTPSNYVLVQLNPDTGTTSIYRP
jgi:uncharacterized protein (TIGR02596 family)